MSHVFPTETHLRTWNPEGDAFGRQELAKNVVKNILTKMETPNVLGIYGDWGTGKTTFLHYLQMVITGKQKDEKGEDQDIEGLKDFRTSQGSLDKIEMVHFEPWKYEYAKDTDLLFALFEKIKKDLNIGDTSWAPVANAALKLSTDFIKHSLNSIIKNRVGLDIQEVAGNMGNALDAVRVEKYGKILPLYESWFSEFDELQKFFREFINAGLAKKGKEKLIIFIDDLDRCLPENTIKLLEAIKNFLYQENVIFVLAIDQNIVSQMIQKKYGLFSGYGLNYLEKIVGIHLQLSRPSLAQVIHDVFVMYGFESIDPNVEAHIISFIESYLPEPRSAKRMVRQVLLNSVIMSRDLSNPIDIQYAFLAEYLVYKWPAIFCGSRQKIRDILEIFHQSTKKRNAGHLSEASDAMQGNTLVPSEDRQAITNVLQWTTLDPGRDPANNKASFDKEHLIRMLSIFSYIK